MARIALPLAAFFAFAHIVSAGVKITTPAAGAKVKGGAAVKVEWEDGGDGPDLADLKSYELFLCAGGNEGDTIVPLVAITTSGTFAAGNEAQGMVGADVGDSEPENAYFLKMVSVAKNGGQLITYSSRFSMTGMTGKFPDAAEKALEDFDGGTTGPDTEDSTVSEPGEAAPDAEKFEVEYTMQTGLTRYAPMQAVPPTKITAKEVTMRHPTSSVSIATSKLPVPKVQTTITRSQTHTVQSVENTVAAAPHATDDMAKFLNRWKD